MTTTTTYAFTVTGVHCASCGMLIDDTLEDLPRITRSTTSLRAGCTTVEANPARTTPDAITETGYAATREQP